MVAGIFVPQFSSREDPVAILTDPGWPELEEILENHEYELLEESIVQIAVAKQLAFAGYARAATLLSTTPTDELKSVWPRLSEHMRHRDVEPPAVLGGWPGDDLRPIAWRVSAEQLVGVLGSVADRMRASGSWVNARAKPSGRSLSPRTGRPQT